MDLPSRKQKAIEASRALLCKIHRIDHFLDLLPLIQLCGQEDNNALGYLRKTQGWSIKDFDNTVTYKDIIDNVRKRGNLLMEFAKGSGIQLNKKQYQILCTIMNPESLLLNLFATRLLPYENSVFYRKPAVYGQYEAFNYYNCTLQILIYGTQCKKNNTIEGKLAGLVQQAISLCNSGNVPNASWQDYFDHTAAFNLTGIYLPVVLEQIQMACGMQYHASIDADMGSAAFIAIKRKDQQPLSDADVANIYVGLTEAGLVNMEDLQNRKTLSK